jgi:hypothetical protein
MRRTGGCFPRVDPAVLPGSSPPACLLVAFQTSLQYLYGNDYHCTCLDSTQLRCTTDAIMARLYQTRSTTRSWTMKLDSTAKQTAPIPARQWLT